MLMLIASLHCRGKPACCRGELQLLLEGRHTAGWAADAILCGVLVVAPANDSEDAMALHKWIRLRTRGLPAAACSAISTCPIQ
eukprot:4126631-Prymnesium_polylepis.1